MLWFGGYVMCVWKTAWVQALTLLEKLGTNNVQTLQYYRLHWFGHVARKDSCINSITTLEGDEPMVKVDQGRHETNDDHKNWKLTRVDPANNWIENIVWTPEGSESPTKFSKEEGGLIGSQFLQGGCWDRGGDFFQGEVVQFFSVITKNLVPFKR